MRTGRKDKKSARQVDERAQSRAFRKAAHEAGVDPNVDIDEVMRRLAGQKRPMKRQDK